MIFHDTFTLQLVPLNTSPAMAIQDLPWGRIVLTGFVAAFIYGFAKMYQQRRFYKDLVGSRPTVNSK